MKFCISEKVNFLFNNHTKVKKFLDLCSVYINTFTTENKILLSSQGVRIKASHFYTEINLNKVAPKAYFFMVL